MIRYKVIRDARVLFIGINPHHGSFARGVPFSNNKTFWYLLNRSGLIKEDMNDLRDDTKLKHIYEKKFSGAYRLALLNIADRPSRDVTELRKGEESTGRKRIMRAIKTCRPRVTCFVGKVTFQKFSDRKDVKFGWQDDILSSRVYVMHFPVRGPASIRIKELKTISGRN